MDSKEQRQIELSEKIIEMGFALSKEGLENDDDLVARVGGALIFLSGVMLDETDFFVFTEMCAAISARKVLASLENDKDIIKDSLKGMEKFLNKKKRK
jgi:hypothetical protein